MSGHSKWSTIKRKKEATDAARGKLFSKLSRAVSIAVRTGGGSDLDTNQRLKAAIESAKAANMPKANIDRALSKGVGGEALVEFSYEGFGPDGIAVIVEGATDNKNRTGQEIKGIFEWGGGRLAGPGSVSFNFEPKGLLVVSKEEKADKQILKLIDLGAEDVEETDDGIEVYVTPSKLSDLKKTVEGAGYKVVSYELVKNPKSLQSISDKNTAGKAVAFLEKLQDHQDVQKVFANLDISNEALKQINVNL